MKRKYITPAIESERIVSSALMDTSSLIYAGGNENDGPTDAESKEICYGNEWGSLW